LGYAAALIWQASAIVRANGSEYALHDACSQVEPKDKIIMRHPVFLKSFQGCGHNETFDDSHGVFTGGLTVRSSAMEVLAIHYSHEDDHGTLTQLSS